MIEVRPHGSLGSTGTPFLDALHHFSFAGYIDSRRDGLGRLRVVNHTVLAPRSHLRPQPIDGVDVVTFVRRGVVEHTGNFGAGRRMMAGEVHLLSTGRGLEHGYRNPGSQSAEYLEFRLSATDTNRRPSHAVTGFPGRDRRDRCVLLASGWPEDRSSTPLRGPARVSALRLRDGSSVIRALNRVLYGYVICVSGGLEVNGATLVGKDAAVLRDEARLSMRATAGSEIILIETE